MIHHPAPQLAWWHYAECLAVWQADPMLFQATGARDASSPVDCSIERRHLDLEKTEEEQAVQVERRQPVLAGALTQRPEAASSKDG